MNTLTRSRSRKSSRQDTIWLRYKDIIIEDLERKLKEMSEHANRIQNENYCMKMVNRDNRITEDLLREKLLMLEEKENEIYKIKEGHKEAISIMNNIIKEKDKDLNCTKAENFNLRKFLNGALEKLNNK